MISEVACYKFYSRLFVTLQKLRVKFFAKIKIKANTDCIEINSPYKRKIFP